MKRTLLLVSCITAILALGGCRKEPPLTRPQTPDQQACLVPCDARRDVCIRNANQESERSPGPWHGPNPDECLEMRLLCALECGLKMKAL